MRPSTIEDRPRSSLTRGSRRATMAPCHDRRHRRDAATPHRVLVAEDEALIRLDLAEMLREEGYEVVGEAGDGQEAVELAE